MNVMPIDMIDGFTRIGAMASPRVNALLPRMEAFIKSLPADSFVMFPHDAHRPKDVEFERFPEHALADTEESKVCQELLDACKGLRHVSVVPKTTHSAFYETNAAELIEEHSKGNDWVLMGCLTDMCLPACIFPLLYRGKNIILPRDLIDTYDAPGHNAEEINAMYFDQLFPHLGCKVTTSQEILDTIPTNIAANPVGFEGLGNVEPRIS